MAVPVLSPKGICHKVLSNCPLTLSPFCQAAASLPLVPSASSVHKESTTFSSIKKPPPSSSSVTAKWFVQNVAQAQALSPQKIKPSASTGTFEVLRPPLNALPSTKMTASISVPSVAVRATMLSPGPAAPRQLEDFLSVATPPHLTYTDFSCSIIPCLPLPSSTTAHSSIFDCIPLPYNPDSFKYLLLKHDLSSHYPLLPFNLRHGFPLRHMPALMDTTILTNNPSTHAYMPEIHNYLKKELLAGRMSGPFSHAETELILHSPFQSSPLVVSLQPQQRGMPDKVRIC